MGNTQNNRNKPNSLVNETSPYLLQHAYNPVEWYGWNDDALERAKKEDKPIFLSVGYSSCHWCHVMAHESFEDNDIAKIMNEQYINIKVDREERPDIDDIYQRACQMYTGTGGWPLSAFLTPDQRPFYIGTYFP
ncbi:MAG TPA: thioredoxin domain-containing protein, partial [Nitrososphaeraceae archaeon]|nr:thioredoxin domain-containing protein [Nitrososphaeraceae archaeon]